MCVHILQDVELERGGHACTVGSGGLNIVWVYYYLFFLKNFVTTGTKERVRQPLGVANAAVGLLWKRNHNLG